MSHILVVETDKLTIERVRDTLGAEGWKVEVVAGHDEAVRAAAELRPRFVLVSGDLPRAVDTVQVFSRARGGPGSVLMLSAGAADAGGGEGADERLVRPFTESQLRLLASRLGSTPPARAGDAGKTLTSREIFGDLLAEVESEEEAARAPAGAPAKPAAPAAAPPARPAAPPAPTAPVAAAPPRPAPRPATPGKDIDDLLSKTLSGLDMTRRPAARPAPAPAPKPAAPAAPVVAPPPAAPQPAPAPPPVIEAAPVEPPAPKPTPPPAPAPTPPADIAEKVAAPPVAPSAPAPAPPPVVAPAPAPASAPTPAQPAAKPIERPAAKRSTGQIDISALEELAKPKTRAGAPAPKKGGDVFSTQRLEVPREAARPKSDAFGDYTLLERIAVGGMAEVWKARKRGVEGFQKTVAIKRILPHLTDSSDFVTMFIDEAKLAAQLDHNNIIHIYDLGKAGDDYYIAMEFVEGKDLRSILNTARQKSQPLPMGLALLIASRLASALDYAHRKKDFDGRELGLVHRDVSPQNVLISHEGEIKLCDFGIVKAVTKASKTQMGALKGKLQYMSPEQAWGRPVDSRSDIFSLGSILFEMLTGRRLFAGESEMSVLESVREGRIQGPRDLDARLPLEVNALVLRALGKEPGDRFQSAGEMQRELEKILFALKPTPSQGDLAGYVRRLFDLEPRDAAHAPAHAAPAATAPAAPTAPAPAASAPRPRQEPAAAAPFTAVEPIPGADLTSSGAGGSRNALWGGIAAVAVIGVALAFFLGRSGKPPAPQPEAAPAVSAPAPAGDQPVAASDGSAVPATAAPVLPTAAPPAARATAAPTPVAPAAASPTPAPRATVEPAATAQTTPVPVTPEPTPEPTAAPTAAPQPAPPPRQEAAPAAPSVQRGDLVELGPGVTAPVLVSSAKPQYPPIALRLRLQGEVVVSMLVDENGQVVETKLLRPFPQDVGFNEAAVATARTAKFRPATKNGVPVKVWFQLKVPFKL